MLWTHNRTFAGHLTERESASVPFPIFKAAPETAIAGNVLPTCEPARDSQGGLRRALADALRSCSSATRMTGAAAKLAVSRCWAGPPPSELDQGDRSAHYIVWTLLRVCTDHQSS